MRMVTTNQFLNASEAPNSLASWTVCASTTVAGKAAISFGFFQAAAHPFSLSVTTLLTAEVLDVLTNFRNRTFVYFGLIVHLTPIPAIEEPPLHHPRTSTLRLLIVLWSSVVEPTVISWSCCVLSMEVYVFRSRYSFAEDAPCLELGMIYQTCAVTKHFHLIFSSYFSMGSAAYKS